MTNPELPSKGESSSGFYLCLTCFQAAEDRIVCHGEMMTFVDPGEPGGERRKPLLREGRLVSHAPRWFLEIRHKRQGPRGD